MAKGILGRKVGMTQIYDDAGNAIPVTVIEAGPCHVLQMRTVEKDGYEAVQLGFLDKPRRLAIRSERGHVAAIASKRSKKRSSAGVAVVAKADCEPKRFVREIRCETKGYSIGQVIALEGLFENADERKARLEAVVKEREKAKKEKRPPKPVRTNDKVKAVDVTAVTKGRGYQGVMRRHGYAGQRASHGVKKVHRHAGTSGGVDANRGGGRPKKGRPMPGQYGNVRVTVRNIRVAKVDVENNLLLIHGAVPGPTGGYVVIRETNKVG